jgi:nucleoside 2-deoxyribosyltransferase
MNKIKALILVPNEKSYSPVLEVIKEGLLEQAIEPIVYDEMITPDIMWKNVVTDTIKEADLIIADVSKSNPNMLYELGFAHALRKPTVLLLSTEEMGDIPFDVAAYQMISYDPKDLSQLKHKLKRFTGYQQYMRGPIA